MVIVEKYLDFVNRNTKSYERARKAELEVLTIPRKFHRCTIEARALQLDEIRDQMLGILPTWSLHLLVIAIMTQIKQNNH